MLFMGKLSISMAVFTSYVTVSTRGCWLSESSEAERFFRPLPNEQRNSNFNNMNRLYKHVTYMYRYVMSRKFLGTPQPGTPCMGATISLGIDRVYNLLLWERYGMLMGVLWENTAGLWHVPPR